jgi:hypothetical protein
MDNDIKLAFARLEYRSVRVGSPTNRTALVHVIQRILGHARGSTTRIYTDPTDPLTREAVDRIGSALWPDSEDNKSERMGETADSELDAGSKGGDWERWA